MNIPLTETPDHLKEKKLVEQPEEKNPGWWSLQNLIGSRAGVFGAIEVSTIPDRWKAVLKSEIDALAQEFNHIELDAHYFVVKGKCDLHLTITPSKVL